MPLPPKALTADARQQVAALSPASTDVGRHGHCTVESPAILDTQATPEPVALDDFNVAPGQTSRGWAVYPGLPLELVTQRQRNMARLNVGSVAAVVLSAIVVLLLGADSYMASSRMNRDAEAVGNSASAPNSPGGINEQPMKDRTTPRQNEPPLVETNVPPAGR